MILACAGSGATTTQPEGQPVPFTTLAQAAVAGQSGGAVAEVIRDDARYRALWAELRVGSGLAETPPAVDFLRQMVIAVALPTQGCVAKVTVQAITGDATGLRVDVLERYPGSSCRCIASSRPFHLVALARRPDPVRFNPTRGTDTC